MNSAPGNLIKIKSNRQFLSAAELIEERHAGVKTPSVGLKRTTIEGSAAEEEELKNAYANLRRQLSVRRIERQTGRAVAKWHEEEQAAEVLRKDGKFESFGYSKQGKLYLEYYEALFLLELNRLQLEYCEMAVSVEQAYVLLLGEVASEKYNNYLVYSTLSRAGYIVVKHQTACQATKTISTVEVTSEHCIWALLDEALDNKPVPVHIKASSLYNETKERMSESKQRIISQSAATEDENSVNFKLDKRKRKASTMQQEQAEFKRACPSQSAKSLVNNLKAEPTYRMFREMFEKLEIIKLETTDNDNESNKTLRSFKISFDLHLHNDGFRRSGPKSPNFSVVIVPTDEPFPTHDELIQCNRQQLKHMAPLLVISVSESKQIQAFLYYMSG